MARIETALCTFVFIVFWAQNAIHLVECEDKRIIIHVPRRIQTVHHHHHHVVLMDPEKKTMTMAKPYPIKPGAISTEGYLREVLQARGHEYEQHEHQMHKLHRHRQQKQLQQQQQEADASHPRSYVEQRKTVAAIRLHPRDHYADGSAAKYSDVPYTLVPASHGSVWRPVAAPVRDKRSRPRIFARLVTTYDD